MYEEELDRLEEVLNNLMLEPEKELRVAVKRQRKDSDDDEAEEPESKKIKTEEVWTKDKLWVENQPKCIFKEEHYLRDIQESTKVQVLQKPTQSKF